MQEATFFLSLPPEYWDRLSQSLWEADPGCPMADLIDRRILALRGRWRLSELIALEFHATQSARLQGALEALGIETEGSI